MIFVVVWYAVETVSISAASGIQAVNYAIFAATKMTKLKTCL